MPAACGGELLSRCPACDAPFSSTFAVDCEECGAPLRPNELFGIPIRREERCGTACAAEIGEKRITVTRSSSGDLAVVELAEEVRHLVGAADLGVVVLDLARRELAERLHVDLVDHRVEDVLARAVAGADEHRDDHPLLVLPGLVAEPDRRRLAASAQLVRDDRRVEVQRERGHGCRS